MRLNGHLHPSNARLGRWLNGDEPQLDDHVENCLRCAGRIETIAADQGVETLDDALRAVLAPPKDMRPRLQDGISRKLHERGDMSLIGDLIGLPYQTVRVLSQGTEHDG